MWECITRGRHIWETPVHKTRLGYVRRGQLGREGEQGVQPGGPKVQRGQVINIVG